MDIRFKVIETIKKYKMLKPGDRVIIACSGGPDSIFLLKTLNDFKENLGVRLAAANLDHGLRGLSSRRDSKFVKDFAKRLGVRVISKTIKAKKINGLSQEESSRLLRYKFFEEAAKKTRSNVVATGHTLDDQAETLIMRVIKGTSLKGLAGIPAVRSERKLRYIRPLINIEKKDIVKFLKKEKIPFRIDRTNEEERYLRNRIRKKVLPYLSKINPNIKKSLANMAEGLREDRDLVEKEKIAHKAIIKKRRSGRAIGLSSITQVPRAIQREIVRDAIRETGGNIKKLGYTHWQEVSRLINELGAGKIMHLPGGIGILKKHNELRFFRLRRT